MTGVLILIYIVVIVVEIAALWRVFVKAGTSGWAAIIPVGNTHIRCRADSALMPTGPPTPPGHDRS